MVLGRFRGVEIVLDMSMLLLTVLLTVSLYADLVAGFGGGGIGSIALAVLGGSVFLGGVVLHEVSHTQFALERGLEVARIRLFMLGGVSEIQQEAQTPSDELAIAVAGPITSALLGGGLVVLAVFMPDAWVELQRVLFISGWAQLALAVFNALPGYPLDGGRALRAFLWRRRGDRDAATLTALTVGRRFGLVVIGVGAWVAIQGQLVTGVWTVLIGWFVNRTAAAAATREEFLANVRGYTLGDVMRPITETVAHDITIGRLLDLYMIGPRLATQAVEVEGRIVALVGEREVERIPEEEHLTTLVEDVMVKIGPGDVAEVSADLVDILQRESTPSRRIVVTDGLRAVGVVTSDEFGRFLREV